MTSFPTRNIAGIDVPDTPLITAALALARAHSTDYAYNHVLRSWLLGTIIASKHPNIAPAFDATTTTFSAHPAPAFDAEVHAVAAILHDLGWDPTGAFVSADKRFEVDGANAARDFLRKEAGHWDQRKQQLVWDAIALHTIGSIVFHKEPEVVACAYGIWADFQGPDRVRPVGLLTWDEYKAVVAEYPRLQLMKGLKGVMCGLCRTKPETTLDNTVGEWGERFVEGYTREGRLPSDMLLTCDLDERDP